MTLKTTATRSALVPRAIFCVPVARWQQATVCVGVWASRPADSILLCRGTFGNQTTRIWNVTPSESLFILLPDDYHRHPCHYHRSDERGGPDYEYLVLLVRKPAVTPNGSDLPRGGGVWGVQTPPPRAEIPKALQNRAKLNPIVKNC